MVLLALLACSSSEPPAPEGIAPVTVEALIAELEAARPRPRIYNFWATWCGPCIQELPVLRDHARAHPEVELVLVNVDLPSLHETKVAAMVRKLDIEAFRHLGIDDPDPAYALMRLPGWPETVPVTLVVTADGRRVRQYNVKVDAAKLDQALAEAVR